MLGYCWLDNSEVVFLFAKGVTEISDRQDEQDM